ncbi:MAG: isoprenylcysteine carboxylmethyltransferase family protein [Anaerolineales bacterium]|nr:isoprenylcysteine carboxylmethyltransferase family protein [Anaerolineales bacterium]
MTKSKDHTGIKITAPTLAIIHITMAILLGWLVPLPLPASKFVQWAGLGLAALGFILGVLALIEFKRVRAAHDSKKPTKALVTSGIYRFTRNPIYLGFVFMLIGLPLSMGIYWGVILIWPLVTFMKNMVIKHEEAYLEKEFKNQFANYCSRVRRWL